MSQEKTENITGHGYDLILRNISLPYRENPAYAVEIATKRLSLCGFGTKGAKIHKRSVDARKKEDIRFVYSVLAHTDRKPSERVLERLDAVCDSGSVRCPQCGDEILRAPITVAGFGPCGMFAALALARAGYRPIVFERGENIDRRKEKVEKFFETGLLDPDSNIQFGAGGAGTFSDGKLVTRINDPLGREVLETFYSFGAPESILTLAKPHIGTDKLCEVVKNIEKEIVRCGGKIEYGTKLLKVLTSTDGRVKGVETNRGTVPCGALILAVGHSARDTYRMLLDSGFELMGKDFSVGARVEHLQEDIDRAMYGDADISVLGHAEYTLSYREGERGVYSFCMCPGGQVICSSSEEGKLVVNGMSNYERNGKNANAAIAVSVLKSDYGGRPLEAISYQEAIERLAFDRAGGEFKAPFQTLGNFLKHREGGKIQRVFPTYRNGKALTACDLHGILPAHVTALMEKGFSRFEKRISGFCAEDALLTGVETRTSAPVRILRAETLGAKGHDNLYPGGEGAGYAGGITSAAIDGLRLAYAVIARYRRPE